MSCRVVVPPIEFAGHSGKLISVELGTDQGPFRRVLSAMTPLHYGTWGGGWVAWLYFVAGVGTATLAVTGTIIWIESYRRR